MDRDWHKAQSSLFRRSLDTDKQEQEALLKSAECVWPRIGFGIEASFEAVNQAGSSF